MFLAQGTYIVKATKEVLAVTVLVAKLKRRQLLEVLHSYMTVVLLELDQLDVPSINDFCVYVRMVIL